MIQFPTRTSRRRIFCASRAASRAARSRPPRCTRVPEPCTSATSSGLADARRQGSRLGPTRSRVPRSPSNDAAYSASDVTAAMSDSASSRASRNVNVFVLACGRSRATDARSASEAVITISAASMSPGLSTADRCPAKAGTICAASSHTGPPSCALTPALTTVRSPLMAPTNAAAMSGERQMFCAHRKSTLAGIRTPLPLARRRAPEETRCALTRILNECSHTVPLSVA